LLSVALPNQLESRLIFNSVPLTIPLDGVAIGTRDLVGRRWGGKGVKEKGEEEEDGKIRVMKMTLTG